MKSIRKIILKLLELEEMDNPDWLEIEKLSKLAIGLMNRPSNARYLGTIAYRFAEDFDVRQKSLEYAVSQRQELRSWLSNIRRLR